MDIEVISKPLCAVQPLSLADVRPIVVIVPSPLLSAKIYARLAAQLKTFADTHVVPLPRTGSQGSLKREWTSIEYARFLISYLDQHRISRAVLIGHSNAGPIAAEVARLARERVAALVLADTIGIRQQPLVRVLGQRFIDAAFTPWLTCKEVAHLFWNALAHTRNFALQVRHSSHHFKVMNHLGDLGVRTILAWGQKDRAMPLQLARQVHHAGQADLYVSVEGGHDWPLTHPEEFALAVKSWLDEGRSVSN